MCLQPSPRRTVHRAAKSHVEDQQAAGAEESRQRKLVRFRYDLRHLYAVETLRAGTSIYRVSQQLGHTSVKTTEIYLAHLTPEEADRVRQ